MKRRIFPTDPSAASSSTLSNHKRRRVIRIPSSGAGAEVFHFPEYQRVSSVVRDSEASSEGAFSSKSCKVPSESGYERAASLFEALSNGYGPGRTRKTSTSISELRSLDAAAAAAAASAARSHDGLDGPHDFGSDEPVVSTPELETTTKADKDNVATKTKSEYQATSKAKPKPISKWPFTSRRYTTIKQSLWLSNPDSKSGHTDGERAFRVLARAKGVKPPELREFVRRFCERCHTFISSKHKACLPCDDTDYEYLSFKYCFSVYLQDASDEVEVNMSMKAQKKARPGMKVFVGDDTPFLSSLPRIDMSHSKDYGQDKSPSEDTLTKLREIIQGFAGNVIEHQHAGFQGEADSTPLESPVCLWRCVRYVKDGKTVWRLRGVERLGVRESTDLSEKEE